MKELINEYNKLINIIDKNDIKVLVQFLNSINYPEIVDGFQYKEVSRPSILFETLLRDKYDFFKIFVDFGASLDVIDKVDDFGTSLMHYAMYDVQDIYEPYVDVKTDPYYKLKFLLSFNDIPLDINDDYNFTPIDFAYSLNDLIAVRLLKSKGAKDSKYFVETNWGVQYMKNISEKGFLKPLNQRVSNPRRIF